ncbi:uncharacterized protein PFL1_06798 [Pseudozyma flocculosa PF-1]|uniref:Probable aspartate--tRNA ligase, cytoplasmic n=2 Tax=Pseudozyma flocculosa TaxID=84751 RepID=A0A5C3FCS4_9BASI|nr:uncharacterized protein PFL1_06798 [Pseudozyma flocculosa PF-1]EPQ25661.1 hypothetical protein PFL1_06798 [Pseudozyma flocculosa PF-1]SPO42070.1 related to aspartate-tRNA ligase [Pseudozyma flocculosa]
MLKRAIGGLTNSDHKKDKDSTVSAPAATAATTTANGDSSVPSSGQQTPASAIQPSSTTTSQVSVRSDTAAAAGGGENHGYSRQKTKDGAGRDKSFRLSSILSNPISRSGSKTRRTASGTSSLDEPRPSAVRKQQKQEEKEKRAIEREKYLGGIAFRRQESDLRAARIETPEQRARYGNSYPEEWDQHYDQWADIASISDDHQIGDVVTLRARIHTIRDVSSHLVFIVLRQQIGTLQAVLAEDQDNVTGHFVRWAKRLPLESIVLVRGKLQQPREPITGASVHQAEIKVQELYLVAENKEALPFNVYDADLVIKSREDDDDDAGDERSDDASASASATGTGTGADSSEADEHQHIEARGNDAPVITQRVRLSNRIIDLRTPTAQAIFRVNAAICSNFRSFLDRHGFLEIHTPKLQGGASESGSSVFTLDYFGRPAFLAQSPQLYKQQAIAADFKRVYEIGPVFRAENSNTARHLTEYTGLDIEMEIVHYYDALKLIDQMLKSIFRALRDDFKTERELIKRHFPHEDLVYPDQTLILPFAEGVRILVESGYVEEDGSIPKEDEDLHTRAEIRLGELIKQKFNTDYYILDKFPSSVRPFYAMQDPSKPEVTNSFDIFIRGQEICTGGQRIHRIDELEKKMHRLQVSGKGMEDYLEGFKLGAPPHAGCGIGLERLVMLYLNLGDVRLGTLFYRDPKSLPLAKKTSELRHPEASTNPPPWKNLRLAHDADAESEVRDLQPLEKLIANYGDSSNTAWLDPRYTIWRHADTGAAVGYAPWKGYAMIIGDPLCEKSQRAQVVNAYLHFLKKEAKLKPIWMMLDDDMEEILGGRLNWSTLSVAAEERIYDPAKNPAKHDQEVARKVRHAKKEGVKVQDYGLLETVPADVVREVDARIEDWKANRKGEQVHMTSVHPWDDMEHRVYYIARDRENVVCAMVVLHQLSPENGYHIKWALDFPGAPGGAIEHIILHAMDANPSTNLTFGASAVATFEAKHGLNGVAVKFLKKTYAAIAEHNRLANKGEFRQKLGAVEERLYIGYPRHGLSPSGIKAIVDFFKQ